MGLPVRFRLPANDSENDPIIFSIILIPSHGKISDFNQKDGAVTYAPSPGYNGTDSFSFQVTDNHNQSSNIAQVLITVNAATPQQSEQGSDTAGTPFIPSEPSEEQPPSTEQTPSPPPTANIVKITLVDSSDRSINDVRLYIKEHPEYATPSSRC